MNSAMSGGLSKDILPRTRSFKTSKEVDNFWSGSSSSSSNEEDEDSLKSDIDFRDQEFEVNGTALEGKGRISTLGEHVNTQMGDNNSNISP